jgi:predicted PhzF superfamily epimerase YddE/YHI9
VAEVGFCGHATIATAVQDIDKAVFYPDDEQFLVERDLTVRHYEVGGTQEAAQVSSRPLSSGRTHRASDPRYWPHG